MLIRESSLLVDQEQLGWPFFLGIKAADGNISCLLTSQMGSLQAFMFPQVSVCR